jgi:hypothetical protein
MDGASQTERYLSSLMSFLGFAVDERAFQLKTFLD